MRRLWRRRLLQLLFSLDCRARCEPFSLDNSSGIHFWQASPTIAEHLPLALFHVLALFDSIFTEQVRESGLVSDILVIKFLLTLAEGKVAYCIFFAC